MKRANLWPERPPPRRSGAAPIVLMALLLLVAGLAHCDAHGRSMLVAVPGTVALTIVSPPRPLTCSQPGWRFLYVPSGIVYRAHSGSYDYGALVLDLTPALDECIHVDGFEQ